MASADPSPISAGPPAMISVACCIAGGGPAGMMLGFLLARRGIKVLVLEKHADFLRDFRGDTIHPSTLEVMHELGLLDKFLQLPVQRVETIGIEVGGRFFPVADFTHLPTHCRFIALIPQWDFLEFIASEARHFPSFELRRRAEVTGLVEMEGRVVGLRATTSEGPLEVRADLVIGADGRHSVVRAQGGLTGEDLGAPMDVLWMRISRKADDLGQTFGYVDRGRMLVMLDRGSYWQCAFVIPKGSFEEIKQRGIESFRDDIIALVPFTRDRMGELKDWDDVSLLTVTVDRLERWYRPGLLCIGDAAHAMSPIGGVGINLAIQDAVAAANILTAPLRAGAPLGDYLRRVQCRRELPTLLTQRMQILIQDRVISPILAGRGPISPPLALRLLALIPALRRIPARLVGAGFRPEHIGPRP
jgi:2-polyprenyl-6-methoxyphenol hydroxylase-like FAD-dependent oxidoreductase